MPNTSHLRGHAGVEGEGLLVDLDHALPQRPVMGVLGRVGGGGALVGRALGEVLGEVAACVVHTVPEHKNH